MAVSTGVAEKKPLPLGRGFEIPKGSADGRVSASLIGFGHRLTMLMYSTDDGPVESHDDERDSGDLIGYFDAAEPI